MAAKERYEVQKVDSPTEGINFRITDKHTDSRVATCFVEDHAHMVCKALNWYVSPAAISRELSESEEVKSASELLKEARKALVCHARNTTRDLCDRITVWRRRNS